jgi:hypothetical protein
VKGGDEVTSVLRYRSIARRRALTAVPCAPFVSLLEAAAVEQAAQRDVSASLLSRNSRVLRSFPDAPNLLPVAGLVFALKTASFMAETRRGKSSPRAYLRCSSEIIRLNHAPVHLPLEAAQLPTHDALLAMTRAEARNFE